MFGVPQLFGVLSVKALGLDANLTPSTGGTECGFVGLTLLFRGLVTLCPDELLASFHDLAMFGSRLFPNALCV